MSAEPTTQGSLHLHVLFAPHLECVEVVLGLNSANTGDYSSSLSIPDRRQMILIRLHVQCCKFATCEREHEHEHERAHEREAWQMLWVIVPERTVLVSVPGSNINSNNNKDNNNDNRIKQNQKCYYCVTIPSVPLFVLSARPMNALRTLLAEAAW